ncbi:sporulation histidine kinase inhibitor Sda [Paenibacillus ginsengarvi]|uniref:Sporulation histidine kinase inhibitor Sda n=1 Tax=Paenibacillus ginsengarvi TaxID=400777 RepID=A0A3B0C7Y5_9BACL|nr:sporulation histidine kinase inhibitor Sda [Paenibacillus ginsengarvi]RKN80584.1 sporulation histidine kinase inhibitor Sda [Paenibacillus ginsengarvi]
MRLLKDEHLVECYIQSVQWKLDEDFIQILRKEIEKRKLEIPMR